MKSQLKDNNCKNMEEWKMEIVRLWTLKMDDSQYLRNLVESMPRSLEEVILRGGGAT
jgi:hypothetical protein